MSSTVAAAPRLPATQVVRVPVTTVWSGPESPRAVDRPMVADDPDVTEWLAALDAHASDDESGDGRLGLHGRVETQLLVGEPVIVTQTRRVEGAGSWSQVLAPWQLSPEEPRGYPGWVPSAHLSPVADTGPTPQPTADLVPTVPSDHGTHEPLDHPAVTEARRHIGLPYLWSGVSPHGFDCSGLVLHAWRRMGVVVARDAYAQAGFAAPVELDEVRSGDLYFFARSGRRIHHVGIVVRPGRMVHASETGGVLVEEDLPDDRMATLVAAGRLPMP
ncbi:hypothetical protein GCM10009868_21160 [Terrabacter aerolatus]|uniref:NlpC/P60 domain-containing protein n=1 Tax=Terrabacter aerolatus TaxID=422442 RepID=A0A512D482_9MICO|nr:C40 family peptidase [Terrabacter aerolatus]GEO31272.1 hypothetical protein TAE01_30820 [Terrabacter aerolatus]